VPFGTLRVMPPLETVASERDLPEPVELDGRLAGYVADLEASGCLLAAGAAGPTVEILPSRET